MSNLRGASRGELKTSALRFGRRVATSWPATRLLLLVLAGVPARAAQSPAELRPPVFIISESDDRTTNLTAVDGRGHVWTRSIAEGEPSDPEPLAEIRILPPDELTAMKNAFATLPPPQPHGCAETGVWSHGARFVLRLRTAASDLAWNICWKKTAPPSPFDSVIDLMQRAAINPALRSFFGQSSGVTASAALRPPVLMMTRGDGPCGAQIMVDGQGTLWTHTDCDGGRKPAHRVRRLGADELDEVRTAFADAFGPSSPQYAKCTPHLNTQQKIIWLTKVTLKETSSRCLRPQDDEAAAPNRGAVDLLEGLARP